MTSKEIHSLLEELGVVPSRGMGQNFLVDPDAARWIVDQLEVADDGHVIEVGAGTGALTEHLAGKGRRLTLIEKDRRLAEYLKKKYGGPRTEVIEADAVGFDLRSYFAGQPVAVIGNLPYSAGGEIVRTFLRQPTPVSAAVFTLQKEVAERLCARPGTKAYGLLSLRVQSEWVPSLLKILPPDVFSPRPQIESAVVSLRPLESGALPPFDRVLFDRLIRSGFSQRRKQLKKLLPVPREEWESVVRDLGVEETVRGEQLGIEKWVQLTNRLDDHPLRKGKRPPVEEEIFDVVDENDEVIGRETRREVHEKNLRHRAVHIFVRNRHGEIFLQKRSALKDRHPGKWDSSASGHLDSGENYEDAARRELEEEVGIGGVTVERVAKIGPAAETDWEFIEIYRVDYRGKMRLCADEVEYGASFPVDEIDRWVAARPEDFAPGFLACWRVFREGGDLRLET